MAYRNWQWFPTLKMSTNKTLMDLAYVAIPPKDSEWFAMAEDKMAVTRFHDSVSAGKHWHFSYFR